VVFVFVCVYILYIIFRYETFNALPVVDGIIRKNRASNDWNHIIVVPPIGILFLLCYHISNRSHLPFVVAVVYVEREN
jgi:hypothetical protein